jgi:hypothetical protein
MHDSNYHQLEELFLELCNSKIHDLEIHQKNGSLIGNGNSWKEQLTSLQQSIANVNNANHYMILQEFWSFVSQEVSKMLVVFLFPFFLFSLLLVLLSRFFFFTSSV